MKLIIDIPENVYEHLLSRYKYQDKNDIGLSDLDIVGIAIKNGTPLPKNHRRLIDADSLIKAIEEKAKRLSNADVINGLCGAVALIFDEQTIIEADKEEEL